MGTSKLVTGVTAKLSERRAKEHWTTYARGGLRTKRGEMNQTERKFRDEFILPAVAGGAIAWWAYEAIQFRLTQQTPDGKPGIRFTPDFATVVASTGEFRVYEVKGTGYASRESLNRLKVLADKFPLRCFLAVRRTKKDGGGFLIEEY